MGIGEQTFYQYKKKFQGIGLAQVRRLRILEENNRKLRQMVAALSLGERLLKGVLRRDP
jgi:putative transposase